MTVRNLSLGKRVLVEAPCARKQDTRGFGGTFLLLCHVILNETLILDALSFLCRKVETLVSASLEH